MVKPLYKGAITNKLLKRMFYPDPDLLLDLHFAARESMGDKNKKLLEQFSFILHDIYINGIWKRTNSSRLKETERVIRYYLSKQDSRKIEVLDLGASDGITSYELLNYLRNNHFEQIKIVIGDIYLYLTKHSRGIFAEYRTTGGIPVMVRAGNIGWRLTALHHLHNPISKRILCHYANSSKIREFFRGDIRIPLIHPVVLNEERIEPCEMDCLVRNEKLINSFSVIRASNILNYFNKEQIVNILSHLYEYLKDNGLVVISRNHDEKEGEVERGTIWQKAKGRFIPLESFGEGSEIKSMVDNWIYK